MIPKQGYKVGFFVEFQKQNKYSDYLNIYHDKNDVSGSIVDDVFKPIPLTLRNKIFSATTLNPFRLLYSDIYTSLEYKRYPQCSFIGLQLEVDDKAVTKEWLIAFSMKNCVSSNNMRAYSSNSDVHFWILQSDTKKQYRVLMESDNLFYMINNHNKAYKILETQLFNLPINKLDKKACGYGLVKWHYQQGRYRPYQLYPKINGCDAVYPERNESPYQREQGIFTAVEKRLLNRLNTLLKYPLLRNSQGNLFRASMQYTE